MSRRECFGPGGYFWGTVIATSPNKNDLPILLAVESGGLPLVARPSMGHMRRTTEDPNDLPWEFLRPQQ